MSSRTKLAPPRDGNEWIDAGGFFGDFDMTIANRHASKVQHLAPFAIDEKPIEMHLHEPPARVSGNHVSHVEGAPGGNQPVEATTQRDGGEQLQIVEEAARINQIELAL